MPRGLPRGFLLGAGFGVRGRGRQVPVGREQGYRVISEAAEGRDEIGGHDQAAVETGGSDVNAILKKNAEFFGGVFCRENTA
jgi:hypothetical protein